MPGLDGVESEVFEAGDEALERFRVGVTELGRVREQLGDIDGALAAYQGAVASPDRDHAFRLSALARCAALYEGRKDRTRALVAYRDIMRHAKDPELVAAAGDRVSQLEAGARKR